MTRLGKLLATLSVATSTVSPRVHGQVIVQSAEIPQVVVAGVATLSVRTQKCAAQAFVNGRPVPLDGGRRRLDLQDGLNVVALAAEAEGDDPWLTPTIEANGRTLAPRWLARGERPPTGWRDRPPDTSWSEALHRGEGLWTADTSPNAFLLCALYVGEPVPQFFPKLDRCYFPRGSRQLMKLYVHAPLDLPQEGYRMVVEVPAALRYVAAEPLTGGEPTVAKVAAFERDGVSMARYQVGYDLIPRQGFELSMRWGDRSNTTVAYQPTLAAGGTFGWRHLSMEVTPPPGAMSAHPLIIKWQNRGLTGAFWVDNVVFREKGSEANLLTMGTFDEPGYGNHWSLKPEGPDGSKCVKVVSTPERADKQQAFWVDKERVVPVEQGKTYVIELDLRCEKLGSAHGKPLCGLLFEAPADMAEGEYPAYTYFESLEGTLTELPQASRVVVLPPLRNIRPKRARISPCFYGSRFKSDEVAKAYAENCWASGITWTYGKVNNKVVPHLLPRGHKVFLSIGWHPWQAPPGRSDYLEEHADLHAVDFAGKQVDHTFCPTWFLSDGDEMLEALEKWLLTIVDDEPYYGANWDLEQPVVDPPTFCTCERCRAAFRKFAGLPAGAKLDPDTILAKYRTPWTDFRCTQNAELAGRLKRIFGKAERPLEFSLYSGFESVRTKEHYGVDWKKMAPHLDFGIAGYGGNQTVIRDTVEALGDVPFMGGEMWYLSDTDDARPAPRMETWRNRLLRQYFTSGCNGCLIWYLPPMDGGAFYATSEAAAIIAENEEFFVASQRCGDKVKVEGIERGNWAAFEKEGEVVVVLLNFTGESVAARVTVDGRTQARTVPPWGTQVVRQL